MNEPSTRRREHAYGCSLPTEYLLQGTHEHRQWMQTGEIHFKPSDLETREFQHWGITCGIEYIEFPYRMGDVWVIGRSPWGVEPYTMYGSQFGLIRTEHSKESELILVMDADERDAVFKILLIAGWQPEYVGELGYIRCPVDNIKYTKNRYIN